MEKLIVGENEAGQRFDKYLGKLMREAPKSFLYKMLRKKNITLNGKKAAGNEMLCSGDEVKLFLSEETFQKFCGEKKAPKERCSLSVIYEDRNILLVNKPVGMLSQPSEKGQLSLVEYVTGYLLDNGSISEKTLASFRPGVCNRLDRNTSGIVAAGKTLTGLQELSKLFHDRSIHKDYLCLVKGVLSEKKFIKGYLHKDTKYNKVVVYEKEKQDSLPIETSYVPLGSNGHNTLLSVRLITGRTHQIRAHLASIGHPIVGDVKYGNKDVNEYFRRKYQLTYQLLHAYRLEFPDQCGKMENLSGTVHYAQLPELFHKIIKEEHLEESYYENLERNLGLCKNDNFCCGSCSGGK